jgi:hypothetical protein
MKLEKKKLLFLITFWFFTNHNVLFPLIGPSILSLDLHLKMGHPSLSHPLLISTCTYLEIHLLRELLLELVELMALTSGEAPLTSESQGKCRLRLVGDGKEMDVPFSDAEQAREWMEQLMEKARCDL